MINKKALIIVAVVFITALMLSSLAIRRTVSSEEPASVNPDMRIYLSIDNIPGESIDENHMNWIDIEAFNWSEAASVMMAGRSAGMVNMKNFVFVTQTSAASPKLFLAVATGQIFQHAKLECWTWAGGERQIEFLEFRFDNVVITSYNIAGGAPQDRPLDQFSISFGKITMTYWPTNLDGTQGAPITAYFDLTRNQGA
jgi:type VI secretion system secreted protein Hcp